MRLLLLVGDRVLGDDMAAYLRSEGHQVCRLDRQRDVRAASKLPLHLIVVDDSALDRSDLGSLKPLREAHPGVPILLLATEDRRDAWMGGLESGVGELLFKPFDPPELANRVRQAVRLAHGPDIERRVIGDIELDLAFEIALRDGHAVNLTAREWQLVKALAQRIDQIVPKAELEKLVHGAGPVPTSNALEVHLWSVRRKLGRDFIRTVRGVGYRMRT